VSLSDSKWRSGQGMLLSTCMQYYIQLHRHHVLDVSPGTSVLRLLCVYSSAFWSQYLSMQAVLFPRSGTVGDGASVYRNHGSQ